MEKRGWAVLKEITTGIFIRNFLIEHGEGYGMEIWRALKEARGSIKVCSYQSFVSNYIWVLKQLGLIEKVRTEPASNPKFFARTYYRITPGKEKSLKWSQPQKSLNPNRALGSKRYKKNLRDKRLA